MEEERRAALRQLEAEQAGHSRWKLTVLVVGASDLSQDAAYWKAYVQAGWKMVLVEPQEALLEPLRQRLRDFGGDPSRGDLKVVNAAVCLEDAEGVPFFTPAPDAWHNVLAVGAFPVYFHSFSSLKRNNFTAAEVQVRCLKPSTLLASVKADPRSVAILHLDAEGIDLDLLEEFLMIRGFAPAVIVFEWYHADAADLMRTVNSLALRGYNVHQNGIDAVAVASRFL